MTDDLRQLLRVGMTFNTPMSEARATALVERLAPRLGPAAGLLDLGCGWGELMLRIAAAAPRGQALGLDLDGPSIVRGRQLCTARGLDARVRFEQADVTATEARGGVVICIGVSWAWGAPSAALAALRRSVLPGGVLLYGDAFWSSPPSAAAREIFGELPSFDGLVDAAQAAGFAVEDAQVATLDEWDAFQAASLVGIEASERPEARSFAETRRREYDSYRGALGFAYLC